MIMAILHHQGELIMTPNRPVQLADYTTSTEIMRALVLAKGDLADAAAFLAGRGPRSRGAHEAMMAAVSGGTVADNPALIIGPTTNDLIPYIRQREIIGKLIERRTIPLDLDALTYMSGGVAANWVGEGKPAPLSKAGFTRLATPLTRLKVQALWVVDAELARSADPAADVTLSRDAAAALINTSDRDFTDPTNGGTVGVKPASVTNGAPAFASSGSTAANIDADLGKLQESLIARGSDLQAGYWIMHSITAAFLSRIRNTNGDAAYPNISVRGGMLLGLPVIVSGSVQHGGSPSTCSVILIDASKLWVGEDPAGIEFAASKHASIEMLDNPTNDITTPTATTLVSLFQTDSIAMLGSRWLNWKLANPGFCAVLNNLID
jgi:HK97 family phage major capsid protein